MNWSRNILALAVLLTQYLSACSGPEAPTAKSNSVPPAVSTAPTPIACGDPTLLVNSESIGQPAEYTSRWAVGGPLRFAVYGLASFKPGSPIKVPIVVEKPLESNVTLKGWRCSDGRPLRFWYERRGAYPFPIPDVRALETVGDPVATLEAGPGTNAYGGYFLFTSPGKWKVSAFLGDHVLASVVLVVSE